MAGGQFMSLEGHSQSSQGQTVMSAVHAILDNVSVPGKGRSGLPADAIHSAAQREALKTRIYPFAPDLPASQFEQLLLLHAFEDLLNQAQPERKFRLSDRLYHERVPKDLLAQTLQSALQREPFVSSSYLPRHDCLLVAMHHRSLPGRLCWHSWKGDLATPDDSDMWKTGLFATPTYNDWAQIVGGNVAGASPEPPRLLQGLDARELGYVKTIEKLATPADGSIILVTKFDRGLGESFPYPSSAALQGFGKDPVPLLESASGAGDAESVIMGPNTTLALAMAAEPKFDAPERYSSRLARVMKDGLAFGIVHDTVWADRRVAERDRRAKVVAATAVSAEPATGSRPGSPGATAEDAALGATPELPFAECEFGQFWLSFGDGARYTVRMHHERADLVPDGGLDATEFPEQSLPSLGAMTTYTTAAGLVIQVFSDGAVRLMWPLAVAGRDDGPALAPVAMADSAPRLPAGSKPYFLPGCPEDVEVMRTITPLGTVVRKLLSGRVEVYHSDSTTAARNPTLEELQSQLADLRVKHGPKGSSRVELLERFYKVYEERNAADAITSPPSAKEKAAGLPGHWVVVRPDGSMFGRAQTPQRDRAPSSAGDSPDRQVSGDSPDAGATETATQLPQVSFEEIMEGVLLDGGMVEYPISTGVSVATQVDLQTQHRTRTNSHGLTAFEDPDGMRNICVHADGTRVTKIFREGGYDIVISKEPMAWVKCEVNDSPSGVGLRMLVECADGAQLDIVPQTLSPSSGLCPLSPQMQNSDTSSSHAWVQLKRPDIASLVSSGTGQVQVLLGAAAAGAGYESGDSPSRDIYVAQCAEARLSLCDQEGKEFILKGDQTLSTPGAGPDAAEPQSPRCHMPAVAYKIPGMDDAPPPSEVLPPRLFVIYGNGEAAELLSESDALELLKNARSDPQSAVVQGEVMPPPLEGCICHTIFNTKTMDGFAKPGAVMATESVSLSLGSLDTGLSLGSLPASPMQGPPPTVTKFRQLISYPAITEDNHQKFLGTLKQYREWEQAETAKCRAIMAGPEDKKKGQEAKAKKAAKKDDKKSKKKKKQAVEAVIEDVVEIVLPKFVEDLNLTVYDHGVKVLRIRQAQAPEPTDSELLAKALATREAETSATKDVFGDLTNLPLDRGLADVGTENKDALGQGYGEGAPDSPPPSSPSMEKPKQREGSGSPARRSVSSKAGNETKAAARTLRPKLHDAPTFSYFKSEMGLQYLLDEGEMDPEKRVPVQKEKRPRQAPAPQKRSPWNPLLLGEAPEAEQGAAMDQRDDDGDVPDQGVHWSAAEEAVEAAEEAQYGRMGEEPGLEQPRLPMAGEDGDAPVGPHPDKKGNLWDIYGQPRTQRPVASHAYVMLNTDFLEVEGATDRRVRTSSIAHKKNAGKAPSVSSIRKTGQHAVATGTEIAAKEILGELGLSCPEEHWKLTSTMQGLGDSNSLVEVTPGICRFGPVRQGGVYRMAFFLRNTDVDVTRFNIAPLKSDFVKVSHQPGQIAPGMAAKIVVEVLAKQPGKVEQLVEVRVKAHIIRVPVTARIMEAEEYDRLDAESMALHHRHIGRHREKSDAGEKRAVEVVTDERYCRRALGENNYRPQPSDCEETPMH
jgi:hypothetical protein